MLLPRSILISFIAAILLFACRKSVLDKPLFDGQTCTGNCFILQGKIIDSAAGTGITGAQVKFWFRPATLRVRVIAATVTNFQFLTVGYHYGRQGYGYVFNGGRSIDTTLVFKTAGDIGTILQSDAVGNGVNIARRDTILVPAGATRTVEVRL